MKILLDTCTFLWWALGDSQVPAPTQALLRDADNDVFLSAVSSWEIAVKHAAGRLALPERPEIWVPSRRARYGIEPLPIDETEALHVGKLPPIHRDPFDRMLVAQAICHGLEIATPDPTLRRYPCRVVWPS
jgi:PIN domain nuclease of toxin-antitoxin system